jgi:hypothetical protein
MGTLRRMATQCGKSAVGKPPGELDRRIDRAKDGVPACSFAISRTSIELGCWLFCSAGIQGERAMSYRGHVRNGAIVLDEAAALQEGAEVRVEVIEAGEKTLAERFAPFVGCLDDLPEDLAAQHDHYIHGTPKR